MKVKDESIWLTHMRAKKRGAQLKKNSTVDIAIIGGGITGLTTAYLLSKAGKKVAVLEKADYTQSVTAYTTAFITYIIDTPLVELVSLFGEGKAKRIWQSGQKAIDCIEQIVKTEHISCDFARCPEYIFAKNDREYQQLEKEYDTARKLGFSPLLERNGTLNLPYNRYLEFPQQAKFHPIKYLLSLRELIIKNGVLYAEKTTVKKIQGDNPVLISTDHATLQASTIIITTYDPFNHDLKLFAKKGMYVSYVIAMKIEKGILPYGLYLDMDNPYHYFRIDESLKSDHMILGGEDHRQEIPVDKNKHFSALEAYGESLIPKESFNIERRWSGPILESIDGLPYIGKLSEQVYVATAFSGNGMTYATIAAMLFTDMVEGRKNPWEDIYNPLRFPSIKQLVQKGRDYLSEFFGGAVKDMVSS